METLEQASTDQNNLRLVNVGASILAIENNPELQRAIEVGEAIDPERTLPSVDIYADPKWPVGKGTLQTQRMLITHDGQTAGWCSVVSDNREKVRWFNGVNVNEKGVGFGMATYKAVIQQAMLDGYSFRTHDWSQTQGAKKVWERLTERGVARVIEPFISDGQGKFNGHYVVESQTQ